VRQIRLKRTAMEKEPANPLEQISNALAQKLLLSLGQKESKVQTKYDYYNADNEIRDFGISTPKKMINSMPGIGWASRAVNTLSDRVVFDGFAKDTFGINDYFESINAHSVIGKAKHDAFIAGCAFIAIADDPNLARKLLIAFTAQEATGVIDDTTGLLKYGLAVTRWEEPQAKKKGMRFAPSDYILFTPTFTAVFEGRSLVAIYNNPTGRTLLHPITHRASADRPLGKSRLTNTARRIINEVGRLKRREEIAEEFYALPQRYINGLAEGAKKDENLDSAIGKVWAITKDEDGEKPDIGQLAQMSIDGFVGAKQDKARDFCAETALTLRNLGYETGNPASSESLAAMSDDLLLEANNAQAEMGAQIKQIAITLRMALDQNETVPDGLKALEPAWKPIFQVDIGAAGDAVFKLFEVMPELQGTVVGYRFLGIGIREAEELAAKRLANTQASFMGGTQ
jgi:hypothetical protein